MKKVLLIAMVLACIVCSAALASCFPSTPSDWIKEGDLQYRPINGGTEYEVCALANKKIEDLVIPSVCRDLPVTSIRSRAFSGQKSLKSVVVPESVVTMGEGIFWECTSLTTLTIPFVGRFYQEAVVNDGVVYAYGETFGHIFGETSSGIYNDGPGYEGGTDIVQGQLSDVTEDSFMLLMNLPTYCIPNSLKNVTVTNGSIPYGAFDDCAMLETIVLPQNVKSIGSGAFYGCTSLKNLVLPSSLQFVFRDAFVGCVNLNTTLNGNARYLGNEQNPHMLMVAPKDNAIETCDIAGSTKFVCSEVLDSCNNLSEITVASNNATFTAVDGVLYNKDVTKMIYAPKAVAGKLEIPDTITEIPDYMFKDCTQLTEVVFHNKLTKIGVEAFNGCVGLTRLVVPDSVTSVGERAFYGCDGVTYLDIRGLDAELAYDHFNGFGNLGVLIGPAFSCHSNNLKVYAVTSGEKLTDVRSVEKLFICKSVTKTNDYLLSQHYDTVVYMEADFAPEGFGEYWSRIYIKWTYNQYTGERDKEEKYCPIYYNYSFDDFYSNFIESSNESEE